MAEPPDLLITNAELVIINVTRGVQPVAEWADLRPIQ